MPRAFIVGSQPSALAINVARLLTCEATSIHTTTFDDGETQLQLPMSVSGKEVFVFQAADEKPNEVIFETLRIIDAAKTSGAKSITVVFPCYPYARQDRNLRGGYGTPPKLIAKLLKTAGADRLVTIDIHAPKQIDEFPLPTYNLTTEALFAEYLHDRMEKTDKILLFAPDRGALPRVQSLAKALNLNFGWTDKQRLSDGTVQLSDIHGNVREKNIYIIDDRIDTGGTFIAISTHLRQAGAKRIVGIVTHGVTSHTVLERLKTAGLDEIVKTDTRKIIRDRDFVKVLSVAELLAERLRNSNRNQPT